MNSRIKPFQNHVAGLLQVELTCSDNRSEGSAQICVAFGKKENGLLALAATIEKSPVLKERVNRYFNSKKSKPILNKIINKFLSIVLFYITYLNKEIIQIILMSEITHMKKLPEDIVDIILKFLPIRCHICYKQLNLNNINNFFCYPVNRIKDNNSHYYCSWICFNYT